MRVLVTGSRTWTDTETIVKALNEAFWVTLPGDEFVIVHGDCPKGADAIAGSYAEHVGWTTEPHRADWTTHGIRAGFIRNAEMVKAGADVCLAFIKDSSRGATHCAGLAKRAGIPVRTYRA